MAPGRIIVGYDLSPAANDGLALGLSLRRLVGGGVLVARVIGHAQPVPDRDRQRAVREATMATRAALAAALGGAEEPEVVAVVDGDLAGALHGLAEIEHASFLVVGSSHHGRLGRAIMGSSAEIVLAGARCPVAIAPPGHHEGPGFAPSTVSVGYDGSPAAHHALAVASRIASASGGTLRIVGARPGALHKPLPGTGERHIDDVVHAAAEDLRGQGTATEAVLVDGTPEHVLDAEAAASDALVMGTHARGPVRRTLIGSVATHVLRRCPVPLVICPPPHGSVAGAGP